MAPIPVAPADLLIYSRLPDPILAREYGDDGRTFQVLPFLTVPVGAPDPPGPTPRRLSEYPVERRHLLQGLDWMMTVPSDVVCLSIGPPGGFMADDPLQMATRELVEHSKVVVVAAGNYGPAARTLQTMARAPWVVSVAAVDDDLVPLDSSSRGGGGLPGPTCASTGMNAFNTGEAGTSFAAPVVARTAAFTKKCLELLVADLRTALTAQQPAWSQPISMPWIGLADTGWDPIAAPYRWGPIAASLLPDAPAIEVESTPSEQDWAAQFIGALPPEFEIPDVTPELVARALRLSARPLPYDPDTVGCGLVTIEHATEKFRTLTPSSTAALLGIPGNARLSRLDHELPVYWNAQRTRITEDAFGTGIRLSVARVA